MLSRFSRQSSQLLKSSSLASLRIRTFSSLAQEEAPTSSSNPTQDKPTSKPTPRRRSEHVIDFSKLSSKSTEQASTASSSPSSDLDFNAIWTERKQNASGKHTTPVFESDLDKLRYYIDQRLISKTYLTYKEITQSQPQKLEIMDHLKVMDMFRTGRSMENNNRLKYIFEQIEKSGFPIAPAVFELMISRVGRFEPDEAKKYFDKFIATHGASSVSLNAYGSLILAFFRNNQTEKARKCADEAKNLFHDLHDLKPVLMELELESGNETLGLKYFKDYIRNESGYLKIAKAYGWLANWYANHDRSDDAICVIEDLTKRGIDINQASYNVLCKIAMQRGQLEDALDFLNRGMALVNLDRFGTLPTELSRAFLAKHDLTNAMGLLKMYRSHASHIRELRYRPYYEVMRYLAYNGKRAEEARAVFNMIPNNSRFRNALAVRLMMDVYLYCDQPGLALDFYRTARRLGFDPDHPDVNEQYVEKGYQEGHLDRVSMETSQETYPNLEAMQRFEEQQQQQQQQ